MQRQALPAAAAVLNRVVLAQARVQSHPLRPLTHLGCVASTALPRVRLYSGGKLAAEFGSFSSDNIEDLVRIPPSQWPAQVETGLAASEAPFARGQKLPEFGSDTIRKHFLIDLDEWTFLNHGAFGAVARPAAEHAEKWRTYAERQPLRFFDRVLLPNIARTIHKLAGFVHAAPTDIAPLPNVTTGLNAVISSIGATLGPKDSILTLNIAYGSMKKMVRDQCKLRGTAWHQVDVKFPIASPQAVLAAVEEKLLACGGTPPKLAIFDHITSNTAAVLPVEELAALCRSYGVENVFIDGAHALLQLPLRMDRLAAAGVTHYVTNAHKWLCTPKGAAMLWAREDKQSAIRPLNISHGIDHGFASRFAWDGCRDYAAFLALPTCIDFFTALDVSAVRTYNHNLALNSAKTLAEALGSSVPLPDSMMGSMALVEVPHRLLPKDVPEGKAVYEHASALQAWLYSKNIEVPVKALEGKLYLRISAHIYNRVSDYRTLLRVLESRLHR